MKLRNLLTTLGLALTLGVSVGAGISSFNKQADTTVFASGTTTESGSYIKIDDSSNNCGWTYNSGDDNKRDAYLHFWYVEFDDSCGFETMTDMKTNSVTFGSGITYNEENDVVTSFDVQMDFIANSNRAYELTIPWFITNFTCCPFSGYSNGTWWLKQWVWNGGDSYANDITLSYSRGTSVVIDNMWNNGSAPGFSDGNYTVWLDWTPDEDADYKYTETTYTITAAVAASGGGTVTGGGTYKKYEQLTLRADPDEGYSFQSWSDSGAAEHTVRATADATYTATFNQLPKLSTPSLSNSNNVITWSAVSNAQKYTVQVNSETPYDIAADGDLEVAARLIPGTYAIHVTAIGDGEHYNNSDTASIQYTISEGYYLVGSFNSWDTTTIVGAYKFSGQTLSTFTVAAGATARVIWKGSSSFTWQDCASLVTDPEEALDYPVSLVGDNLTFTNAGDYSLSMYWDDDLDGWVFTVSALNYVAHVYKLVVGTTEYPLTHNVNTEYVVEEVDLSAGQSIGYKKDGTAVTGVTAKAVYNNNVDEDLKIVANTDNATIYVDVATKTIWTGLAASEGYHMLLNGDLITMTHGDDFDGFTQWYTSLTSFAVNDVIRFVDVKGSGTTLPSVFDITTINQYGLGPNFDVVDGHIKCITASSAQVYIKLKSGADEVYFGQAEEKIVIASEFASDFNDAIEEVCEGRLDGTKTVLELRNAWQAQISDFEDIVEEAQEYLKDATAFDSVEVIRLFIAKYTKVVSLYGEDLGDGYDFLEKFPSGSGRINVLTAMNGNNGAVILTVLISTVALSAVGGYFFLRKRKED